ncbi:2'-5' RNA ligase family protein [Halobacillus sp. Marseille-P3879]|uniref:2'-5' RNA ligase family protein n=1 Tax=Halobacillus sp. Marseille-P3879 TaxID=2045014 RepID=UPI00135893DB|nr:2'-5' RNA ligase family protein [Halobacillus sp. Marseille-P3879]
MAKTIGLATLLSGQGKNMVYEFWNVFEKEYNSVGVQSFDYPNLGYQGGSCEDINLLKIDVEKVSENIHSFEVNIEGFGYFEEPSDVVYLKVKKNNKLTKLHSTLNNLLTRHCDTVFDLYKPNNWVPHITLAMGDISPDNLTLFRNRYQYMTPEFTQLITNISLVEFQDDGDVELIKKYEIN